MEAVDREFKFSEEVTMKAGTSYVMMGATKKKSRRAEEIIGASIGVMYKQRVQMSTRMDVRATLGRWGCEIWWFLLLIK